jgi:Cd2+/Zn2+-exporting ATPase/Cu+-exporting ATPase
VQRFADRLAGYLVYFAIAAAALTYALTRDARSTISVIIVAGACGIAAGTRLAILGTIGRAARQGAIVKGGRYLETLARVDTVAIDKTGTLTYGTPSVAAIEPLPGVTSREVVEAAAIAERRSEHPLARAILEQARTIGRHSPAWRDPDCRCAQARSEERRHDAARDGDSHGTAHGRPSRRGNGHSPRTGR